MASTSVFSQGVKFIKIARVDNQGNDNTLSLQELNNIRIKFNDVGVVDYPITSIAKYDDYFLFGIAPTNITSSTDNEILNYRFSASYTRDFASGSSYIIDNYGDYGAEAYDNLNYFDINTGRYTLGNQPNIPIRFTISASVTASLDSTVNLFINSNIQGVVATKSQFFDVSSAQSRYIMSASYTGTPLLNEYFYLSISPGSNIQFTGSFFVTQSTAPQAGVSDLVVMEPFIDENFVNSDYDVLAGNAVQPRINPFYMDIDYSTNALKAVNIEQILSGSATRATVQPSNYTYASQVNGRYAGSKTTSINYNTYTPPTTYTTGSTSVFGYNEYWPGDEAYGKQASIDIYRNYFAKFINITSSTPEIPGGSKVYITELIDINGNRFPLGQDQYTLDVAYNFTAGTNLSIYNFTNISASLIGTASVIDGGSYFQTILISTGSNQEDNIFGSFSTFYNNNGTYGTVGNFDYKAAFTSSQPNVLSAVMSNAPTSLANWLYPFLTSSYQSYPLVFIGIHGVYNGIYSQNTNNITYGDNSFINLINYSEIITPIQPNDYIRIGVTGSSFATNNSLTSSYTYQIIETYIDPINNGITTGSLTLNGNITNLPSPLGQAYIIYRRIPSDSYITINKEINSNSTGLIIPSNFNPAYDPIKIARDAGVI